MRQHYKTLQNLLTEEPQTILDLSRIIYPDDWKNRNRRLAIDRSLIQLREDGLAESYVKNCQTYWVRPGFACESDALMVKRDILVLLTDGKWWTTRTIAESVYDDFKNDERTYMNRTGTHLQKLKSHGLLEKRIERGPFCFRIAKWRLSEAVA